MMLPEQRLESFMLLPGTFGLAPTSWTWGPHEKHPFVGADLMELCSEP